MVRRKNRVVATRNEHGLTLLNTKTGTYWQLNLIGAHIYQLLDSGATLTEIEESICTTYDVDDADVASDVTAIYRELVAAGLVEKR